ncbi:MAG: Dabb family protein [Lentisphaerae bacterium]|nr:Dabb family protein [Lentisphaerota bacterium]
MKRVIIIALIVLAGCVTPGPRDRGTVHHVVLCWLKEPGNPIHRRQIIEASKSFRKIPSVLEVHVGEPIASDRPIVDDSFDVALSVSFATVQGMNEYLAHPLHEKAKTQILLPVVKKILVYDFEE